MNCHSCNTEMKERKGNFGIFVFCYNQFKCGQKTTPKANVSKNISTGFYDTTGQDLVLTAELMNESLGPLFKEGHDAEPFVNCLGDEVDCSRGIINHFRPYG